MSNGNVYGFAAQINTLPNGQIDIVDGTGRARVTYKIADANNLIYQANLIPSAYFSGLTQNVTGTGTQTVSSNLPADIQGPVTIRVTVPGQQVFTDTLVPSRPYYLNIVNGKVTVGQVAPNNTQTSNTQNMGSFVGNAASTVGATVAGVANAFTAQRPSSVVAQDGSATSGYSSTSTSSGSNWMWWLLLLIVIILVIWWLMKRNKNKAAYGTANAGANAGVNAGANVPMTVVPPTLPRATLYVPRQ